jgi:hypothetical protein
VTLIAHQANKQLNDLDTYKKNALNKTSSNKWVLLQKGAMIQSKSQPKPKGQLEKEIITHTKVNGVSDQGFTPHCDSNTKDTLCRIDYFTMSTNYTNTTKPQEA